MPVFKWDETVILQRFLFCKKMAKSHKHDSINHHLVKIAFTHSCGLLLFHQVNDWVEGEYAD
jgi:hypothetical protein